jgi:HAD superfamily hydrolase (TIGR01549 family)
MEHYPRTITLLFTTGNLMVKNIIFDFDGVILDSMKIKGEGFRELFKEYGEEKSSKIVDFHFQNGGVSRYEKIRYFHNTILKKPVSERAVSELAQKFGTFVYQNLGKRENLISETVQFLKENSKNYSLHVASGADERELKRLCRDLDLERYFISIHGSPTPKPTLVKDILETYGYRAEETILIGDSYSDYESAKANGIGFRGYNNRELESLGEYIESFDGVEI